MPGNKHIEVCLTDPEKVKKLDGYREKRGISRSAALMEIFRIRYGYHRYRTENKLHKITEELSELRKKLEEVKECRSNG